MPLPQLAGDRVLETSTTSGTGAIALAGAVTGFTAISALPRIEAGSPIALYIEGVDAAGAYTGLWETGIYTWNADNTLTRATIQGSSNAGAAVNWPATGTRRVGGALLASELQAIRDLRADPTAQLNSWKVSFALSRAKRKAMRVLLIGTSIASFDNSAIRIAAAQLQATYGLNKTQIFFGALIGGGYGPSGSIKKQAYGGQPPLRASFETGATASWSGVCDGFNVVYSTETDAGNLEIRVDGTLVQTINCAAAQTYSNVWSNTFTKTGYHTITLTGTGTYAPVERVELRDDGPGVFVENATMGGVGLYHVITLYNDTNTGNRAGIAATGNNGIDAVFNRTAAILPDMIIQEHFTNDGPTAYTLVRQIMDRAAITTLAKKTAFVVVSESPNLDSVTAAGKLSDERERMRALFMSYGYAENIVCIDWIKLIDFSNKTAYEARYFPGTDKVHPTTEAYLPLHLVFADLFETNHPGVSLISDVDGQGGPAAQLGLNPFSPDPYSLTALSVGAGRKDSTPFGGVMQAFARAGNMISPSAIANVFLSDKAVNVVPASYLDAIDNSTTLDRFGPYVRSTTSEVNVGQVRSIQANALTDVFTLCILARSNATDGRAELRMYDDGSGRIASFMLNEASVGGNLATWYADKYAPRYYYVSFKRFDASIATFYTIKTKTLDVYGIWCVEGTVPVVTSRNLDRARFNGFPGYMTGDYVWDQVIVGAQYLAVIPGKTVPLIKRATDALVMKQNGENKKARLYEVVNRADYPVLQMLPTSLAAGAALVYDEGAGSENYAQQNSVGDGGSTPGLAVNLTAAVNGEQWTFGMRNSAVYDAAYLRLSDAGGGNAIYLQPNGTWSTNKTQYTGGGDGTKYPSNIAITFNMPTGAAATALTATPRLFLEYWGPNQYASPATLVRGASACI